MARAAVIITTLGRRGGDWRPRPRARRSGTSARGTPAWPAGSAERLPPAVATCWSSWRLKLLSTLLLELNLLDQLGLLGQLELDPPEHLLMKKLASGLVDATRLRLDLLDHLRHLASSNVMGAERLRLDRLEQQLVELRLLEQPTSSEVDADRLRLDVLKQNLEQLKLDLLGQLLSSNVVDAEERLRLDQLLEQLTTALLEDGVVPLYPLAAAQLLHHPPAAGPEASSSSASASSSSSSSWRPPRGAGGLRGPGAAAPGGGRRIIEVPPSRLRSRSRQRGPAAAAALLKSKKDADDLEPTTPRWEHARHEARMSLSQSLGLELGVEVGWGRGDRWLEIPLEVAFARAAEVARCAMQGGGKAYVGSTSNPAWRFRGGWYLTSGRNVDGWDFMPGHHEQWQRMVVVGCWRDRECAEAEKAAILHVQAVAPGALENKCEDARGLSIRTHGYSFVYCCYQERNC